jgi:hypothetical protein
MTGDDAAVLSETIWAARACRDPKQRSHGLNQAVSQNCIGGVWQSVEGDGRWRLGRRSSSGTRLHPHRKLVKWHVGC